MEEEKDIGIPEDAAEDQASTENPDAGSETPEVAVATADEGASDESAEPAEQADAEGSAPDEQPGVEAEAALGEVAQEGGEAEDDGFDKVVNEDDANEDDAEASMLAMLNDLPSEEPSATPDDIDFGTASAGAAEFQQLSEPAGKPEIRNIDLLMDVNLPVSIELGRTQMSITDILALGPGSVVELNKLVGEPVDLMVNYKMVARGEVVVIDENFGVRITQLLTSEERIKILGE